MIFSKNILNNVIYLFFLISVYSMSLVVGEGNAPESTDWESFKSFHHKRYPQSLETVKKSIFNKNVQEVEQHNKLYEQGLVSYSLELNSFSDQDPKVFSKTHNGFKRRRNDSDTGNIPREFFSKADTPSSWDWSAKGAVSPVKYQGACGDCYAFAAVAAIESQVKLSKKSFQSLSEQQITDCDKSNGGCGGGDQVVAMRYVQRNGGIQSDSTYPFTSGRSGSTGTCKFDSSKVALTISGYKVADRSVSAMMSTLVNVGPMAISIFAEDKFQKYSGGIYSCSAKNSRNVNHAVLLVGYGTEKGEDYWLIKNSYGTSWGLKGFFKMSRTSGKDCGVLVEGASYPRL